MAVDQDLYLHQRGGADARHASADAAEVRAARARAADPHDRQHAAVLARRARAAASSSSAWWTTAAINLAGVQRLLSIAEVVQRIRPLMRDEALSARDARRRLAQELDELRRMLGFD